MSNSHNLIEDLIHVTYVFLHPQQIHLTTHNVLESDILIVCHYKIFDFKENPTDRYMNYILCAKGVLLIAQLPWPYFGSILKWECQIKPPTP